MSDIRKINLASYRVLNTLLCLFEKDMEMNTIISSLEEKMSENLNNFVVSKYINTCKCCGIDLQKVDGKYALLGLPFDEKFNPEETSLLNDLRLCAEDVKTPGVSKMIDKIMGKLHLPLCKSSNGIKSSENFRLIRLFEKACAAKSDVEFIFKNGETRKCSPVEIKLDENDQLVFNALFDEGAKDINPYDLADVKLTDSKVRKIKYNSGEVIYELRGKLAKRYQLREHEQLIRIKDNGNFIISNKYEDKDKLLRRLMRYDVLCKVMKPNNYADEMKKMIEDTLKNYE